MKPEKENLYTRKVVSGNRTYYFDAKRDDSGKRCVQITENLFTSQGENKRHKVMLFESALPSFISALQELDAWFSQNGKKA